MVVVGVDEAGYGPLLGPLVVAAVVLECERYLPDELWRAAGPGSGIADSKVVLSHRSMGPGETTALGCLAAAGLGPRTRAELFASLLVPPPRLDGPWSPLGGPAAPVDEAPCNGGPGSTPAACTADSAPLPRWGEAAADRRGEDLRARLAGIGARLVSVRATVLCPGRLNRAVGAGVSKGLVDYRLFAGLLAGVAGGHGEVLALCDKLGGRSHYGELLVDLGLVAPLEEGRQRSAYGVAGLGRVEFERAADSRHLPVAIASMVAKLVREHVLDQWHSMLAARLGSPLGSCSGYHDPVTARYVEATAAARAALGVPDRCFVRLK